MSAAISANPVGLLVAFGAGMLSFLSPCVLPLVPGYLSMVSGLSATELEAGGSLSGPSSRRLLRGIGLFIAGFTLVFTVLGAAASGLGHLIITDKSVLSTAAGALIICFGVILVATALPAGLWIRLSPLGPTAMSRFVQERRFQVRPSALGSWAPPLMGMAFAFGWTPCIGPVLAAVLGLAAARSTLAGGVTLLIAYSLGLGVPFLATGIAFGRLTALYARARRTLWLVHVATGVILVVFGVLLVTGQLGWLSDRVDLMRDLGLDRLTTS